MSGLVNTLGLASGAVIKTSDRIRLDSMFAARALMTLRRRVETLDQASQLALAQLETIINDLDADCCAALSVASANIDQVIEFVQTRSAYDEHQINDPSVRDEVLALTGGRCAYCWSPLVKAGGDGDQFCVEHVIPSSKGGPNNIVNYVPACRTCNSRKGDKHVLIFVQQALSRRIVGDRE